MKGAVGTSMGGPSDSRKWAIKRNLKYLVKAKDILRLPATEIDAEILALAQKAVNSPSLLETWEGKQIMACWYRLAESGRLRGIRGPGYLSRVEKDTPGG